MEEIDDWRLRDQEMLWKQRSRVDWLCEGDRNTKNFHAKASLRRRCNWVKKIQIVDGTWLSEEEENLKYVQDHIKGVFEGIRKPDGFKWDECMSSVSQILPTSSLHFRNEDFNAVEVKEAMFQLHLTKAPGPYGFSAIFFQRFWSLIGHEITSDVLKMLNEGKIEGVSDTIISLIPKSKEASKVEDFRPISLCNVTAKLITRVLANRLKKVLPDIISVSQGAFVFGRSVSYNFILAQELESFIKSGTRKRPCFLSSRQICQKLMIGWTGILWK